MDFGNPYGRMDMEFYFWMRWILTGYDTDKDSDPFDPSDHN